MKKCILLVPLILFLFANNYRALCNQPSLINELEQILTAELLPPEQNVVAGQSIVITLKIKNVSSEQIILPSPKWIDGFIISEYQYSDGKIHEINHKGLALGHGKFPGGYLKPKDVLEVKLIHVFPKAGYIKLKCTLDTRNNISIWQFWEGHIESKPITIDVQK